MQVDLSQLSSYQDELQRTEAAIQKAKTQQEYLRLQIKQTKAASVAAKKNSLIKAFVAKYGKDNVEVMPAPGTTYVTVHVNPTMNLYHFDPVELGIEFRDSNPSSDRLNADQIFRYASHGVTYYVIKRPF